MATKNDIDHEELMQEVAFRMETSKLSRRPARTSLGQTSRRHSARVEKPRSTHPSPIALERRRTVSTVKQYASLDDHYRKMFGLENEEEVLASQVAQQPTRPVSWHPSSAQTSIKHYQDPACREPYEVCVAGDVVNMSLEASPAQKPESSYIYQPPSDDHTWSRYMHGQITADSAPPSYSAISHEQTSWFDRSEAPVDHGLPTFQHYGQDYDAIAIPQDSELRNLVAGGEEDRHAREQSEELIGLGLYDEPGSTSPSLDSVGKSLKLEEQWEPPEDMEEADADEESSEEEDEPPKPDETRLAHTTLPIMNLSGHSFLFEEDEGIANEWWYHQLNQPTQKEREIGCGWL